jgi:hypothetical protein
MEEIHTCNANRGSKQIMATLVKSKNSILTYLMESLCLKVIVDRNEYCQ